MRRWLAAVGLALVLLVGAGPASAGPVSWIEVEPTSAGRQWWDEGSLKITRNGMLTVLSRFQPAEPAVASEAGGDPGTSRPRLLGDLYVMEIDCGQGLFRDTSINGIPRWNAEWQALAGDGLIEAVVSESCTAAGLQPSHDEPHT